ncbi:MAG: excinuclease ABC subunit UvrB [Bacillales bacterium]|jgi:excinuclease ABC subunit B|nr:excinuclease ABC subunit UvrB [Bacillales bacterium]
MKFELLSDFTPKGDQEDAIDKLSNGVINGEYVQVLLGATGTGKTYTISKVIEKVQKPTLVLVHNKTLAWQLYQEFKDFFPYNRVEYFISNFDFYQPEAYLPSKDIYIEKNAVMNEEIELLRSSAIASILQREDTIIVASVASIYALNDPDEYRELIEMLEVGQVMSRKELQQILVQGQYNRNDIELSPGVFRVKGENIDICLPSMDSKFYRISFEDNRIIKISLGEIVTGKTLENHQNVLIFPAATHASRKEKIDKAIPRIEEELKERALYFKQHDKPLEEERILNRTRLDIEALKEFSICPGIENYSRHIEARNEGDPSFTLFDYFPKDFLLVVDESHVSLPQIRGMYFGDRSRKINLVEYGFRLPSALDNRPLQYEEFNNKINQVIYVSATPGDYELAQVNNNVVEQIIRPTGLLDPKVEVRSSEGQIDDLIMEIKKRNLNNERTLITTMTVKMAEDLTTYLINVGLKVIYLHHENKPIERTEILYNFRKGKYDVLVGINLLREGLDLPELSLIAILDADKEGFLRSKRSLVQIIGRAARNVNGTVILYGDKITDSMQFAIDETNRRRKIQNYYNIANNITPTTIIKELRKPLSMIEKVEEAPEEIEGYLKLKGKAKTTLINKLTKQMKQAGQSFNFEKAIELREIIKMLKGE